MHSLWRRKACMQAKFMWCSLNDIGLLPIGSQRILSPANMACAHHARTRQNHLSGIKTALQHVASGCMQIVAKECINSQKAIQRLHMQKAHFLDMECALKEQLGMALLSY